jgi:hypothetical protein
MVVKSAIQQWREYAPWTDVAYIEQDLIISRTLIAILLQLHIDIVYNIIAEICTNDDYSRKKL